MADPIKVSGVSLPGDNMDPAVIDAAAGNIRTVGTNVSTRGGTLQTTWQGLAASYHAPEQEKLFTAMTPATNQAAFFGTDMGTAATALETFATELETIKTAVAKIKSDATTFLSTIKNGQVTIPVTGPETRYATSATKDVAWDSQQDNVDTNNALIHRMNQQQEALWAAERTCANSLNAISGTAFVGTANPETGKGGYGYTDLPDNAQMPWGSSVSRREDCSERMAKGFFVDGLFNGLVQGVTSLVGFSWTGPDGVGFSWSTFGHAWEGVGKLATATSPLAIPLSMMPGPVGDWTRSSQKATTQLVTGLVGIDPYAKDPYAAWHHDAARTFGSSLFNVASFIVPETKVGNIGKVGEAGGDVARVAEGTSKVGRVINLAADGAKWMKGVTLDGLSTITGKIGDFGKTFTFGDHTIPKVERDELDTGHTNLGGHDHTDAPPARTDVGAHGDGTGTPHTNPAEHTPVNDPALAKHSSEVKAQVDQIKHDIEPELQKQADAAWQHALARAKSEGIAHPSAQRLGTYAHTSLEDWLRGHRDDLIDPKSGYRIEPEASFDVNGPVASGEKGSIRPDIVIVRETASGGSEVVHVIDLKTGRASIGATWESKVQGWLDPLGPSETLRPHKVPPVAVPAGR